MTKLNVWGWSADSAGCAAYRVKWVADAITRHYGDEIDYQYGTVMSKEQRETADVVVGQRVCLSGPTHFWQQWSREGNKVLIMELDDDLWSVPESNARGSAVFNNTGFRSRLNANVRASDWVTVSTEPLRQAVHNNTGFPLERIVVVPNALSPELVLENFDDSKLVHTLGYLCSPTHKDDFAMVKRHLKRFLENNPQSTFHTIGTDYGSQLQVPRAVHHTDWVKSPEDAILGIDYAISICPLVPTHFNKSKSDCKFLEAAARGAVTITSDVAAYAPVVHGETGFKVRREHEWGRALQSVLDDPVASYHVARNAWSYVRDERTTDATAPLWREVLTRGKA
jgi:hypothetical protein